MYEGGSEKKKPHTSVKINSAALRASRLHTYQYEPASLVVVAPGLGTNSRSWEFPRLQLGRVPPLPGLVLSLSISGTD